MNQMFKNEPNVFDVYDDKIHVENIWFIFNCLYPFFALYIYTVAFMSHVSYQ